MNRHSLIAVCSFCLSTPLLWAADQPTDITPLDTPPPIVTAEPPPVATQPSEVQVPPPPPPVTEVKKAPELAPAPAPTTAIAPPVVPAPAPTQALVPPPAPIAPPAPMAEVPAPPPPEVKPEEAPAPIVESSPPLAPPVSAEAESTQPNEQVQATLRGGMAKDYQLQRPNWGTQLSFSPGGLGGTDISGGQGLVPRGFSFSGEFQPQFLQSIGVFSLGPSFAVYPLLPPNQGIENSPYGVWSFGGQFKYQARFFREQLVVPVVGYDIEKLSYSLLALGNGSFTISGPEFGLYILMNSLEPSAAYDFYKDSGILRTYLTAEIRSLKGSNPNLAISGTSYYFGIRTEF